MQAVTGQSQRREVANRAGPLHADVMHDLARWCFSLLAAYHFAVGVPSILSVGLTRKIAGRLYQLSLPEVLDPRYEYALKAMGFYALTIALICLLPFGFEDPGFESAILCTMAFLLFVRALGRFFYRDLAFRAFGISWQRSRINVIFNILFTGLLLTVAYRL